MVGISGKVPDNRKWMLDALALAMLAFGILGLIAWALGPKP